MGEETKPTKSVTPEVENAELKNLKLGVAFCVVFAVGLCSGAYLALSGFFG